VNTEPALDFDEHEEGPLWPTNGDALLQEALGAISSLTEDREPQ
jgi:hypothetical protein